MKIHGRPRILPRLQGIDELFGDGLAEADVVAAAAPQPTVTAWEWDELQSAWLLKPFTDVDVCVCGFDSRTSLPVPAVVAATVVEISEAAVPG